MVACSGRFIYVNEEIEFVEQLQNDLFCVEWDINT